jgi:transcriptional regulator with XRE-family HTH domain
MIRKNTFQFLASTLAICCMAGLTMGQDEDVQETSESVEMTVIGGDGLGGAPMIFTTSETFEGGESTTGMRIMSGGPGGFSMMTGMGDMVMPAPDPFSMLGNPSVQKDLELVGDQLKEVQDMQAAFAQEMKDQIGDLSKGGISKDRFKDLPALMAKLKAQQREKMESMLLPHQIDRLRQVALQTHMKQAGTAGALASEQVAEALGISEEQIEKMKTRSKEINAKLAKDMEELKEKAKEELLGELTADQRKKLKEMTGDKYEPQNKDWQESIDRMRPRRKRVRRNEN